MTLLARLNRRFLVRYRIEYVLALVVLYGVRALSPAFAWRSARMVGRLAHRLGVRRAVVERNLRVAFPDLDEAGRREIARRSFEHLTSIAIDLVFQKRMLTRRSLWRKVEFDGWNRAYLARHGLEGMRRRTKRMIYLTGHFGNWELGSGLMGLLGLPVIPVYRRPQNPFFADLIDRLRLQVQDETIEKRGAVARMIELLDREKNIGFLFDQEAVYGLDVPFFGRPARTHKTPAALANEYGAFLQFGVMIRRGDFLHYRGTGAPIDVPPPTGDRQADNIAVLKRIHEALEERIREHPEQYFWLHRRWKRGGLHGAGEKENG